MKTLAQLKRTAWYKNLVADVGDKGEGYKACLQHALTPGLKVRIVESNEHRDDGVKEHAVDVVSDPGNWMAVFKKRSSAEQLCTQMGWNIEK